MRNSVVYSLALVLIVAPFLIIPACTKNTSSSSTLIGNWIRSSDFDGNARSEAVTFTIGDNAYVATGLGDKNRLVDVWQYDINRKFWKQQADYSGSARSSAIGFAVGGMGYVGTGFDGVNNLNDMYMYDPGQNKWFPKNPFGGTARYDAIAFTLGNKAYVGTGYDGNYLKDLWQYDPGSDTWTQKSSIGGTKRTASCVFILNNLAYVCSGNNNGAALNDLWSYDASSDTWTQKRNITNTSTDTYDDAYTTIPRFNGTAFVMNGKGYITTGINGSINSSTWEYDPATDLWTEKTAFEGTGREGALAITIQNRGFVLTGRSGSSPYDNMYEFKPDTAVNTNDN